MKHLISYYLVLSSFFVTGSTFFASVTKATSSESQSQCAHIFNSDSKKLHASFRAGSIIENERSAILDLRANAAHLWEFLRDLRFSAESKAKAIFEFKGLVAGDSHIYNFGAYFRSFLKTHFAINDLDDGGKAPFIGDFLRLAITVEFVNKYSVSYSDLYEAYKIGVQQNFKNPEQDKVVKLEKPDLVRNLNNRSENEIREANKKYIKKTLEFNEYKNSYSFKSDLEKGIIPSKLATNPEDQRFLFDNYFHFEKALPPRTQILATAFRTKTSGGSQNLRRILFAVKMHDEEDPFIFEFKPQVDPGTAYYQVQDSHSFRLNQLMDYYWPEVNRDHFKPVEMGDETYFMRLRTGKNFEIMDEEDFDALEPEIQKEYILYLSYWLGKKHGKQLESQQTQAQSQAYYEALSMDGAKVEVENLLHRYINTIPNHP